MATYFANLGDDKVSNSIAGARDLVGVPFSVANMGGLRLWLSADQNVYSDNGTTPAGDTDGVYLWGDRSTRGNDASQSISGSRPTYNANDLNGLPTISFNSDYLTCLNPTDFDCATPSIFIVGKWTSGAGFCGKGDANNTDVRHRKMSVVPYGGGSFVAWWTGTDAMSACAMPATATNWSIYGILSFRHNLTHLFNNGVKTVQPYVVNTAVINTSDFTIGCGFPGGTEPAVVDIAEMIVFNRVLLPHQTLAVNQYLSDKYAIEIT